MQLPAHRKSVRACEYTFARTNENAQCPSSGARGDFQTSVDGMARCGRDKLENVCQGQFMLMAARLWPHHFQLVTCRTIHNPPE